MKKNLLILFLLSWNCAFSQVYDNFSDYDFTTNPLWSGETASFKVNSGQQLQTLAGAAQTVYLASAATIALNVKWEFFVQLNFSPSATNQTRIYLLADQPNLKGPLNGYFIQIGESGDLDSYDLYKQTGSVFTQIIQGADRKRISANQLLARVQVTRNVNGLWEVKTDITGGHDFTSEGTTTDLSHTSSNYFGVYCKYTVSNADKFIFDDFSIEKLYTDTIPPKLVAAHAIDSLTVEVLFDEAVDSITAKNTANHLLDNNAGKPHLVTTTINPARYILKFAKSLRTADYVLTVTNIKDMEGNNISGNITSFYYKKPFVAKPNDLVINEIFADPSPQIDLPGLEFLEILNTSATTISLKNWVYKDATTKFIFSADSIKPGEDIILCAKADTNEFKQFGKAMGISPWPSLNNSGDTLQLISPEGLLINSVAYHDTWYRDKTKKGGGWTLERADPLSKCLGLFNWYASVDSAGGTPGRQNSVYRTGYDQLALVADSISQISDTTLQIYFNKHIDPSTVAVTDFSLSPTSNGLSKITFDAEFKQLTLHYDQQFLPGTNHQLTINSVTDCGGNMLKQQTIGFDTKPLPPVILPKPDTAKLFITEIFADPSPEVGLPLIEFIEIFNPGKDTINLDGWILNDPTSKATIKKANILPLEYVILCPTADTASYKPFGKSVGMSPWPSLNNTSDQIVLKSFSGRTVDSVAYTDSWYRDKTKKGGGWTLERIDPQSKCTGFFSWNASLDPAGGTPGRQNSVHVSGYDQLALVADSISQISDTTLQIYFNKHIDSSTVELADFTLYPSYASLNNIGFDPEFKQLTLSYYDRFLAGTNYKLTISSISDCSENAVKSQTVEFKTKPIQPVIEPKPDTAKLFITEIFADPSPEIGLPLTEFIEIFNPGRDTINLDGWVLNDPTLKATIKKANILPLEYVILCPAADTASYKPFGKTVGISPWPSLNNTSDQIVLKSFGGRIVDSVAYRDSWYRDEKKKSGGWTLERADMDSKCSGMFNWYESIDSIGGTPGRRNSVYNQNKTAVPLKLLSVVLTDSVTLQLNFNRFTDSLSLTNITNYLLNNGAGNPVSVAAVSSRFDQVSIKFSTAIARGNQYRLSVTNITDCAGSVIEAGSDQAEFIYPKKIAKGDILINEILFNPRSSGVDFVEIYNQADYPLDLKDLAIATFKDSTSTIKPISTGQLLMQPKQYLVLTTSPDNIRKEYTIENLDNFIVLKSMPSFNDDAGNVVLLCGTTLIDQFSYTDNMHFPLIKDPEGVSLERSSFKRPANEHGNFRSATAIAGYATPGYKNSQYADDVSTAEELTLASETLSPDNDGFEDALLINYKFDKPGLVASVMIYNDKGMLIRKLARNTTLNAEGVLNWDGLNEYNERAPTGIYLVFAEVFDEHGHVKRYRKTCAVAAKLD